MKLDKGFNVLDDQIVVLDAPGYLKRVFDLNIIYNVNKGLEAMEPSAYIPNPKRFLAQKEHRLASLQCRSIPSSRPRIVSGEGCWMRELHRAPKMCNRRLYCVACKGQGCRTGQNRSHGSSSAETRTELRRQSLQCMNNALCRL